MTVRTRHAAHPGHIGHGHWGRGGGGQVDDPLAVGPGAGNPLAAALTDEEAVTGAPHVLAAWGGIADGGGFVAGGAFHYMLVLLPGYVNRAAADPAADHRHAPAQGVVGRGQLIWSNRRHGGRSGGAVVQPIQLRRGSGVRTQQWLLLNILGHTRSLV